MNFEPVQAPPFTRLDAWFRSPLGEEVVRLETESVRRLLANTFGYYLIQVGATNSFGEALASSRIRHRIQVPIEPSDALEPASIVGLPDQLPLSSDSIDAVLLPHTLDFSANPKAVLGEVERVLIPEGRVVVVGFNALSAWGLRRVLWRSPGRMPWCGRFFLAPRVEGWLVELGFDIEVREALVFCPPIGSLRGRRCARMERLGKRFWPMLGAVYVIRAVKRVATLTPIKPVRATPSRLLAGRAVRPTTRGTGHA
ncbi:class I SAM-dependent methyltransferase [Thiorhodococcus mannitoliphagus]|uniref:Class I SAM-dependent methyltransferase n=1 Tax=Thiorhodococcus mannitoliphagus TaxID=329406 RepID=A0A6P1DU36_9GAMM|nr:methyltransferase domain-containing protein [Thiorhodococcus mannitoliphagus]NEX20206.1 class I SAM-dependent methyltransferase [Thiorhodococcus mannitoliphagus]